MNKVIAMLIIVLQIYQKLHPHNINILSKLFPKFNMLIFIMILTETNIEIYLELYRANMN